MGITSDASGNGSPTIIRLATELDAEQIADIYAPNVSDTSISFELEPPSADEMRRRIEGTLERYPWLVCERQERVLGYAYAGAHGSRAAYQWSVDVSCGRVSLLGPRGRAPDGGGASPVCLTRRGAGPPGLLQCLRRGHPRCQTRRASGCTSWSGFGPSGSSAGSAKSWARGTTWGGGTSRYANG